MISLYLTFRENPILSSKVGKHYFTSYQGYLRVTISPDPHQYMMLPVFLTSAIPVSVKRYIIVILICTS